MTTSEKLAYIRSSIHGTLHRIERSFEEIHTQAGQPSFRSLLRQWEMVAARAIAEANSQAEEFDDDEIRQAVGTTLWRTGYMKCEIRLGGPLR